MTFSKRERLLLVAVAAVLCVLALDVYVLTPFAEERAVTRDKHAGLQGKLAQATGLLRRRRVLGRKWSQMLADGLQGDPAEAESKLLWSLRDWSGQAGVRLSSLRPERSSEETTLPVISVDMTGTGSMQAVSRLLWQVETAPLLVRITMLQLGSRKDGADDLSIHLKVTTLYAPEAPASGRPEPPAPRRGGGAS